MTKYYPARIHDANGGLDTVIVQEPTPDYISALGVHAARLSREGPPVAIVTDGKVAFIPRPSYWRDAVLLDLHSVDFIDASELRLLLDTCPTMSAIFKLGWNQGALNERNRRDAYEENPT